MIYEPRNPQNTCNSTHFLIELELYILVAAYDIFQCIHQEGWGALLV